MATVDIPKIGFNWSPPAAESSEINSVNTINAPSSANSGRRKVPSGYASHDDSRRRGYVSNDELNSNRRSTQRGYNSNDELLTPERLSRLPLLLMEVHLQIGVISLNDRNSVAEKK